MPCCNCKNCDSEEACFPTDNQSLERWRKDFDGLRKQWSNFARFGQSFSVKDCDGCTDDKTSPKMINGRFRLAWVSETPHTKQNTPCGWELEIYDTLSRVEHQCNKMEEWVNNPPIKPRKNCNEMSEFFNKKCAVRVMPYTLESEVVGCNCCSNCKICYPCFRL